MKAKDAKRGYRLSLDNVQAEEDICCACGKECKFVGCCFDRYAKCDAWMKWFNEKWNAICDITKTVREARRDRR